MGKGGAKPAPEGEREPRRAVARRGEDVRRLRLSPNTWRARLSGVGKDESPRLSGFRDDVEIPPLVSFPLLLPFLLLEIQKEKSKSPSAYKADTL